MGSDLGRERGRLSGRGNVILIGMPGVGKSSVGVVLAKAVGLSFLDSDILIQQKTGRTLPELIAALGPDGFLRLEEEINAGIEADNCVIATGGSAVYGESAMRHFHEIGTVVYLAINFEDLTRRLGDLDHRGVVRKPGQTLAGLYEERRRLYERYADVTVREGAEMRIVDSIRAIRAALAI